MANKSKTNYGTSAFYLPEQLQKGGENEPLLVTNVGFFVSHKTSLNYSYRDDNHDYLLVYQHKGTVRFSENGVSREVSDGGFVFIPPEVNRTLYYFADETNERYYVYFKGADIKNVFASLDLNVPDDRISAIRTGVCPEAIAFFVRILEDFKTEPFERPTRRLIALLNIFQIISDKTSDLSGSDSDIAPAVSEMELNPFAAKSIKDYADMCHMSVQTFIRKFKRATNTPPWQYAISVKLAQIKNILASTTNPIADVALTCNFDDPFYFSRFFKQHVGMSPLEYRKRFADAPASEK